MDTANKSKIISKDKRLNSANLKNGFAWMIAGWLASLSPFFGIYPFGTSLLCAVSKNELAILAGIASSVPFGHTSIGELAADCAVVIIKYVISNRLKIISSQSGRGQGKEKYRKEIPIGIKTSAALAASFAIVLSKAAADGFTPLYVYIVRGLAVPVITFFLCGVFQRRPFFGSVHKNAGITCIAVCAVFLVSEIKYGFFSLPFILSSVAVLAISERAGYVFGGLAGFISAFPVSVSAIPALGAGGLVGGLFFKLGRKAGIISFALMASAVYLYFDPSKDVGFAVFNIAVSCLIYVPLSKYLPRVSVVRKRNKTSLTAKEKRSSKPVADAFYDIARAMDTVSDYKKSKDECETISAQNSTMISKSCVAFADVLKSREKAEKKDDKKNTALTDKLISAVNLMGIKAEDVKAYGDRTITVMIYGIKPDTIGWSANDISSRLSRVCNTKLSLPKISAKGISYNMILRSVPVIKTEYSKISSAKSGEKVCGDSISVFGCDNGYCCFLICDGMGSGKDAAMISKLAAVSFEKLLCVGVESTKAIEIVNSMLVSTSDETFTTIDLFEADVYTGTAKLLKSGAAPTFMVRNGIVSKIQSNTLPAGILNVPDYETTEIQLTPGDYIIMLSDGAVADDNDEKWFKKAVETSVYSNSSELVSLISNASYKFRKSDDDMSICAVKIHGA